MPRHKFPKGHHYSKGRPKGSRNKLTRDLKTAFLLAFDEIGGATELARWASKEGNKGKFFLMLSRMLPNRSETVEAEPEPDLSALSDAQLTAILVESLEDAAKENN